MNTDLWLRKNFTLDTIPKWHCPTCKIGLLDFENSSLKSEQTTTSKKDCREIGFRDELIEYRFIGIFRCLNWDCKDLICVQGLVTHENRGDYNHIADDYIDNWTEVYEPLFFTPPLNLFEIKDKCPPEIKVEIRKSFSLFWNDLSSCVNKIRVVVEMLMDDQKIPTEKDNNKKTKKIRILLQERIELFGSTNPDIANHLLAIKFIGNLGSHVGDVQRQDVIDSFDILEYSLEKLYDDREKIIIEKSARIRKKNQT
jgi:hypothetical protein